MKVLLIDGAKAFAGTRGKLNDTMCEIAKTTLKEFGHEMQETRIDDGYDVDAEVQKFLWAEMIIYQMPAWWMGPPWIVKKYMDEVFNAGNGIFYEDEKEISPDQLKLYGKTGLLQGRHYMLSVTWNAPAETFLEYDHFFDGRGVDAVYLAFHKAHQFLGLKALPTFLAANVDKDPHIDQQIAAYKTRLSRVIWMMAKKNFHDL